jgi:hypothetical protein
MDFEQELILLILNSETNFSYVCVDDGLRGAQEGSDQNDGCLIISTYFLNHKVYMNI